MSKLIEITLKNKHRAFEKEDYHVLAVKVLIEREIKTKIDLFKEKWTRSDGDKHDLILILLNQKINRRKNNQCNKFNFKEEHKTITNELIHLFSENY